MPKLSSFSGLSSRGFGEFGTTLTLTTVTFTSSTSWTAPAGVTNLTTVSGRGSNGQPDYWSPSGVSRTSIFINNWGNLSHAPYATYADVYNEAVSIANYINSFGTGPRTVSNIPYFKQWLVSLNSSPVDKWDTNSSANYTEYVNGAAYVDTYGNPTSGNIVSSGVVDFKAYDVIVDINVTGAAGTASTGFSQTFPGGAASGGTAPITVFNNVSVSPGTSYSIVIPTDRPDPYITIQYLAPT